MTQVEATEEREQNARGEGGRLRTDLLEAAVELMAKHGSLEKVSVRAVAAAARVSPTSVYRHFDSHVDLLWASVQYCFDGFTAALAEAYQASDDPYQRLDATGRAYVRFALENVGMYRVMFSNRVELPPRAEPVGTTAFDHLVLLVTDILNDRGDDRDPMFVAVQVWTWIHGFVDLVGCHPGMPGWPDVDALLDELLVRLDLQPN